MMMPVAPYATYDAEVGALQITLAEGEILGTEAFPDSDHLVDVAVDGSALGLEILSEDLMLDELAERYGFEDALPSIMQAIAIATGQTTTTAASSVPTIVSGRALIATSSTSHSSSGAPPVELVCS